MPGSSDPDIRDPDGDPDAVGSGEVRRNDDARWRGFWRELFHSAASDDIFGRSAQLAYYFFFAIFPGFIFLSALLAMLSGSSLQGSLMAHLPRVMPHNAFYLIQQTFTETTNGAGKITFGALVALWSATVGMAAACDTLNAVHDVNEGRPYWRVRLIALGLTIAAMVLLLGAIIALFWGDILINHVPAGGLHLPMIALIRAAAWALAFLQVAVIFALVYFFGPDVKERKWHWITPGATIAILLWIVATIGLRVYLHFSRSFSATYGSLGAVMVLLMWFYIGGLALLMGAEINAVNEDAAAQEGDPEAKAKGEKQPEAV